jgi:hypothetical protein
MLKLINCRSLIVAAALCLAAANAITTRAQTSASSGLPAAQSAQAAASSPGATPSAEAPATSAPTAQKVWTNEDVTALHGEPISTFAKPNAKPAKASAGMKPGAAGQNSQQLLNEIKKLQGQIPPLDSQIAQLQAAIEGQPTGDAKTSARPYGAKLDSWQEQLAELQKKRDDTLARIGELQDQARHNGVPGNSIP